MARVLTVVLPDGTTNVEEGATWEIKGGALRLEKPDGTVLCYAPGAWRNAVEADVERPHRP